MDCVQVIEKAWGSTLKNNANMSSDLSWDVMKCDTRIVKCKIWERWHQVWLTCLLNDQSWGKGDATRGHGFKGIGISSKQSSIPGKLMDEVQNTNRLESLWGNF
eukprot:1152043-Pelagomonas_calceolata.AAC.1